MARIIEAKAVISAEDRTGKVLDGIARKFKEAGKGAKVAADVGKLGRELDRAAAGLRQIESFRGVQGKFGEARTTFRAAQGDVARLGRELDSARKAAQAFDGVKSFAKGGAVAQEMVAARRRVSDLERQMQGAQRAVRGASEAYERQAAALKASRREVEGAGLTTARLTSEQKRLEQAIEGVNGALARQGRAQTASKDLTAGMASAGRAASAELQRAAERAAQSRRLLDGLSAPARAEAEARARARIEAEQTEARRRASASGDLIAGMGGVGAREHERIGRDRRVIEGMSASGRLAVAERERVRREASEARAQARAERAEAAGALAAGGGIVAAHRGKDLAKSAIQSAAEFDLAVRKQKVFTDITPEGQAGLLAQAKRIGQETQFSNIDVVKAQTAAMQGLPANFGPDLKAAVAEGIVGNVRNFSTLMETDLKDGMEIIRGYLQQAGKDISTKEKALFEANKATNQLVKMAKLGGMNGEDVKNYTNYAISAATASGLSTEDTMALGALARRGGLRGDVAGVAVRSMASKIVAPTRDGIAALNAAGIRHSDYVRMPERLSTDSLEGQFRLTMGKGFSPEVRKRMEAINADKALIADRERYVEAVTEAAGPMLGKTKKGTVRASDAKVAAKAAGAFHKVSGVSVDAIGLLDAAMSKNMTLPQLNAWLTDKHGGKAAITQKQWDEFRASREQIKHAADDPDWAKKKADEVFAGLGGAVENLKGSFENLILTIGNANAGLVKWSADGLGSILDGFSKLPESAQQAISLTGLAASTLAGLWGTLKLTRLALGLGGKAAAGAAGAGAAAAGAGAGAGAAAGGAGAGAAGAAGAAGGAAAGAVIGGVAVGGAAAAVIANEAVKNKDFASPYLDGGMLGADPAGYGLGAAIQNAPDLAKSMSDANKRRLGSLPPGTAGMPAPAPARLPGLDGRPKRGFEGQMAPLPPMAFPSRPGLGAGAGAAAKTIPVGVVSLPQTGTFADPKAADRIDPSGQLRSQVNTLDRAAEASATAANGGKPIEATVKPDQITAKISEIPPVSGEANVLIDNKLNVIVSLNEPMLQAKIESAAGRAVAKIPLSSAGSRPGATSMPGAATTPGAAK